MARHSKSKHAEDNGRAFGRKLKSVRSSHRGSASSDASRTARTVSSANEAGGAPVGSASAELRSDSSNLGRLVKDTASQGINEETPAYETTMGDLIEIADETPLTRRELRMQRERQRNGRSDKAAPLRAASEIVMAIGLVIALYVVWMLGWTGILASRSQQEQLNNSGWVMPASGSHTEIAPAQAGDPPVQPTFAGEGDLIGQIYLPSVWGVTGQRTIVQGTSMKELDRHGYGHYDDTQMPGELGNFAIAGHSSGYGEPGGRNTDLKKGDALIVRTEDYWYIYKMTDATKVLPNATEVTAPVPNKVGEQPTKRYITLTTCWPKYQMPTHRYIVWGEFDYWAKVSDGVPKELYAGKDRGATHFSILSSNVIGKIPALDVVCVVALLAFVIIYIAAAIAWGYPASKEKGTGSICGFVWRHLSGIKPVRVIMMILLAVAVVSALFEWAYPWAAANVPVLQEMSNFTVEE